MTTKSELVYALKNALGDIFYVGRTCNPKRRLTEHRVKYGADIALIVLQDSFVEQETPESSEAKWIAHYETVCPIANVIGRTGNSAYQKVDWRSMGEHKDTRTDSILIRIGSNVKAAFQEAADIEDLSLSDWLRKLAKKRLVELEIPIRKSGPLDSANA